MLQIGLLKLVTCAEKFDRNIDDDKLMCIDRYIYIYMFTLEESG